jgi:hypothetical protein
MGRLKDCEMSCGGGETFDSNPGTQKKGAALARSLVRVAQRGPGHRRRRSIDPGPVGTAHGDAPGFRVAGTCRIGTPVAS